MKPPLFVRIGDHLVDLASYSYLCIEDKTLCICDQEGNNSLEFEYGSVEDAEDALEQVQQMLTAKGLFLGSVD